MKIFWILSLLFLSACASSTKQVDSLNSAQLEIASVTEIKNVPFIQQEVGHCGPATLSMALAWAGKGDVLHEVTSQVYTPSSQGSFQTDMISAARRQGMMALPISGFPSLLKEIDSGHPVIVFENLSVSWWPQWHYAIVFGYDLQKQEVLMHSGPEQNKRWDFRKFERSWKLGDYWGLVVLPAGQLSPTASELSHVQSAAALEQLKFKNEALRAYHAILKKWPESLGALIGLGNITYTDKDYRQAEKYLKEAVKFHPDSSQAWHNLSVVQGKLGAAAEAQESRSIAQRLKNHETPIDSF